MNKSPADKLGTVHGSSWRRKKGELLDPMRLSAKTLIQTLEQIGAVQFAAQYLQQPGSVTSEWHSGAITVDYMYSNLLKEHSFNAEVMGNVSQVDILKYELFGIGHKHPARPWRRYGVEEWIEKNDQEREALAKRTARIEAANPALTAMTSEERIAEFTRTGH